MPGNAATAVKLLAETPDGFRVGGYGLVWGGADTTGDYFDPRTDFFFDQLAASPMVLYQHGQDGMLKRTVVGRVVAKRNDDVGLWIEAQITAAKRYAQAIRRLVDEGVLGWSSGAVAHLVERVKQADGRAWLKTWPIAEFSLTPTPAEPRTLGVRALKSLASADPSLAALLDDEVEDGRATKDVEAKPYRVEQRGDQHCVVGPAGRTMGCHDTAEEAMAQMRALYANTSDTKADWDTAFVNNLPDSAFAYVEPGGTKDEEGKTVPRALRHFPHHDPDGSVDLPHLRNALSRAPQSPLEEKAMPHLMRHARAAGIGDDEKKAVDDAHEAVWRDGAAAALYLVIHDLDHLAEKMADQIGHRAGLEQETKAGWWTTPTVRQELRAVADRLRSVIERADGAATDVDAAALGEWWRLQRDLLEV